MIRGEVHQKGVRDPVSVTAPEKIMGSGDSPDAAQSTTIATFKELVMAGGRKLGEGKGVLLRTPEVQEKDEESVVF